MYHVSLASSLCHLSLSPQLYHPSLCHPSPPPLFSPSPWPFNPPFSITLLYHPSLTPLYPTLHRPPLPSRYQLMLQCWQMHQKQRPRFTSIIDLLATDLSATFKQSSYYYNMERHRGNVGAAPPSAVATPLCGSPLEDDDVDTASAASSLLRRHSGAAGLHAPAGGALGGSPPQGSDAVSQHSTLSYNSHVPTPSPPKQPPAAAPQTHPLADRAPHGGGAPWAGGEPAGGARRNSRRAAGGAGGDGETGEEGGTSKESSGSNSSGGPPINGLSTKHIHSAYLPPMRCTDC